MPGIRHGKLFITGPCKEKAAKLFSINRNQLRTIVEFLTRNKTVELQLLQF